MGELSQQPMWPHDMQIRKFTQLAPIARHSWQPSPDGVTSLTDDRWEHSETSMLRTLTDALRVSRSVPGNLAR